ncbi:ATP-binding protein [Sphaerisporangium sp. NPDC088356]|uniref:ATP-binding protein n=1 Tax=Sphaerisporangium sp. NPDC088356 TaxID=3154871 RepID=UPI003412BF9D
MADRTIDAEAGHDAVATASGHRAPELVAAGRDTASSSHPARRLHEHLTGRMVWRRVFPGLVEQAPRARALVRCLLADTCWADDAVFVTAELINNALLHTRSGRPGGYFVVELIRQPSSVRIGVYDLGGGGSPDVAGAVEKAGPGGHPALGTAPDPNTEITWDLPEDGRGLMTVRRLAWRVGCDGDPAAGHLVWAVLTDAEPLP